MKRVIMQIFSTVEPNKKEVTRYLLPVTSTYSTEHNIFEQLYCVFFPKCARQDFVPVQKTADKTEVFIF